MIVNERIADYKNKGLVVLREIPSSEIEFFGMIEIIMATIIARSANCIC